MDLTEYKERFEDKDEAPGWDAIESQLSEIYEEQEPLHWGTMISYRLGGPDPLDGISAYHCREGGEDHLHFCSFGYSSLYYDEECFGGEHSGYGFEMTFRLASELPPKEEPMWVCALFQNLARYVFETNRWFDQYHWLPTNGPICSDYQTDIVGLAFVKDPVLKAIDSPHGQVDFIQAFGITQSELDTFSDTKQTAEKIIEEHREDNPLLITNLNRKNQ